MLEAVIFGLIVEVVFVIYVLKNDEVKVVFEFNGMGDWDSGFFSQEAMGIAALYSYGVWLVITG